MLRWLESGPYWIIYYLVYIGALLWQAAAVYPALAREDWAAALTVAAGIALTATIVVELGVRTMLLIPKAIHDILERGRAEGRVQGREEGRVLGLAEGRAEGREEVRREILEQLVADHNITEERRKELEAELRQERRSA